MEYYSLNNYLQDTFGGKVYKIAIDAGFSCPNRDGRVGFGGCIFCSGSGSGDFAGDRRVSISEQIEEGRSRVESKMTGNKPMYIAYFQAYTNTYAAVEVLRERYMEAIKHPQVVAISVATRPDCLGKDVIDLLAEISSIKPVWVELGLQTIHESTAKLINRGYELETYKQAVERLLLINVHIVTHVILGLPGETKSQMLETVGFVGNMAKRYSEYQQTEKGALEEKAINIPTVLVNHIDADSTREKTSNHRFGIKLQLLHVIRGTKLAEMYEEGQFETLDMDEYVKMVADCLEILPKEMVIHRITGDGDKKTLIAPLWSGDKKRVLNALNKEIKER